MSRPRFLADNDLKDAIIRGVRRREPAVAFVRLRDLGLESRSDADVDVLGFAAENNWLIVSHDVNTMTAEAFHRITASQAHQDDSPSEDALPNKGRRRLHDPTRRSS